MQLEDIVQFWSAQYRTSRGQWLHPEDEKLMVEQKHSFNLDFPVSPYVGDVLNASIIIIGANACAFAHLVTEAQVSGADAKVDSP